MTTRGRQRGVFGACCALALGAARPAAFGEVCALALSGCAAAIPEPPDPTPPPRRATVSVRVSDHSGLASPGAWVTLTPSGRDAQAGADGVARFGALSPGEYAAEARAGDASGHAPIQVDALDRDVEITLSDVALGALRGTLLRADGGPADGAVIRADGFDAAIADGDGEFLLDGLEPGPHAVEFALPGGVPFRTAIDLRPGSTATVGVALPARPPEAASFTSSAACAGCHADIVARWQMSGHSQPTRPLAVALADPPVAAALDGVSPAGPIPLGNGATASFDAASSVTLRDADGVVLGPYPLEHVYGGRLAGWALAAGTPGGPAVLPIAWSNAEAQRVPPRDGSFVSAFVDGWFDADFRFVPGAPAPAASWDLACAGCHQTGWRLDAAGDRAALSSASARPEPERAVGCEACHGPGSAHVDAEDDDRAVAIHDPGDMDATSAIAVCARCHARARSADHPFANEPGAVVSADGLPPSPWDAPETAAEPHRSTWAGNETSRLHRDQAGDYAVSAHRDGPYRGACSDCHDPHGSEHPASLRADPFDNVLCTGCHALRFPDLAAEAEHTGHARFAPGPNSPGACVSCHMPRAGLTLRGDAVTGVGESHGHTLFAGSPGDALADFDAAGADVLPLGAMFVPGCVDCHQRAQADAERRGGDCGCPHGDLTQRATWDALEAAFLSWASP